MIRLPPRSPPPAPLFPCPTLFRSIQGSLGFGLTLVTVPALALVLPEALPVAVITLGLSISIGMLRHEHHALDRVGLAWILAGRVPGSVVGAWVVAVASTTVLEALAGAVVLAMVLASVAMPVLPVRPSTQLVAGVVSGVTGTAAGIGGPPLALLYQHRPGSTIRSTLAAAFLVRTALPLAPLAVAGEVGASQVLPRLGLAPVVVVGSGACRRFPPWLSP